MGYTQQDIDGAFAQLTAQGYTPSEANAYINGVLAADGQGVQEDPRLTEMYADWSAQRQMETEARELQAYDDTVRAICAADPQIVADDFHAWVSVAGGDFDRARDLYYADVARRAARAEAEYNNDGKPLHWSARGSSPTADLHEQISNVGATYAQELRAKREAERAARGGRY